MPVDESKIQDTGIDTEVVIDLVIHSKVHSKSAVSREDQRRCPLVHVTTDIIDPRGLHIQV